MCKASRYQAENKVKNVLGVIALVLLCTLSTRAPALTIGQVDTFEGSIDNWSAGGGPFGQAPPVPPQVVDDGGPGGPGDGFLQITSQGGSGPGSRLVAMNIMGQWAGNYLAAGVSAIGLDLRNLGDTDLTVRLLFEDPIPLPPENEAVTSLGILLPAGGGWTHAVFPIGPAFLTALEGSATTVLQQTTILRIIHAPTASDAVPIAGVLGVDNIRAIPEPASTMLLGAATLALFLTRRREPCAARAGT